MKFEKVDAVRGKIAKVWCNANKKCALRRRTSGIRFVPRFPKAQLEEKKVASTFKEACDLWLQTKGRLEDATLSQYSNALIFWQQKLGTDVPVQNVTHGKVAAVVGSHPWPSAKLCNNYLIPLRGVFKLACRDIQGLDKPLDDIENASHQKVAPDPLTVSEMYSIIDRIKKKINMLAIILNSLF